MGGGARWDGVVDEERVQLALEVARAQRWVGQRPGPLSPWWTWLSGRLAARSSWHLLPGTAFATLVESVAVVGVETQSSVSFCEHHRLLTTWGHRRGRMLRISNPFAASQPICLSSVGFDNKINHLYANCYRFHQNGKSCSMWQDGETAKFFKKKQKKQTLMFVPLALKLCQQVIGPQPRQ